ncbi:hypothetical protein AB0J38_25900 [Streptomyces sp. NPDC050095]|uniref:hypothetical protein n=1 Tax=unclassified Streptomyces TaxID=2593676 RepID=UPI00344127A0
MTSTRPGADELRLRGILRKRGVGPDAEEQPLPPMPAHRPAGYAPVAPDPDAWFLRLFGPDGGSPIESEASPAPDPDEPDDSLDEEQESAPRERTRPRREAPRRALAETAPRLSPRMGWLVLHAAAAAIGWPLGLVRWGTDTAAWFAAGHWTDSSAWALYFLAAGGLALYRRTRHTVLLVAVLGAVPVSSVALGVLLYGTPLNS